MGMIQYFDEDVDIDRFMQVARRVNFGESVNLMYVAATIYTKEPHAEVGLALFDSLQAAEASPYRLLSRAMFLAELPERRSELVEICKHIEQEHKESPQARIMALWVLALAGRPDLVKTAGASLNADFSDELNYWGAAEFLQYLNGSGDDRNTIFRVQRSVVAKYCPLQFDLGLMALAEGRKSVAKRYFQACVDTDIFAFIEHHFARGFLSRMRDTPDWPEWIETSDPETPSR